MTTRPRRSAVSRIRLGCVADDFTGATDLANNLVRAGMSTVLALGIPVGPLDAEVECVVVALKSRTAPADEAILRSLEALAWLRSHGATQIYFKYCSTFDSTPRGNIGPVTEALMNALRDVSGSDFTISTPAFPDNQRTVFNGHLFVGDRLLNESGMQNHPLTPMTDPDLVRVLQAQTRRKVGLVDYRVVAGGPDAIRSRFEALRRDGVGIAIVDAVSNDDLVRLGPTLADMPLVTAGSGVAIGLPANYGLRPSATASALPRAGGKRGVLSGSCSPATNRQVRHFLHAGGAAYAIDVLAGKQDADVVADALTWYSRQQDEVPVLVYSTAEPAKVRAVQERLGAGPAGAMIERLLAQIGRGMVERGVRQLIVAGGETSGACVHALGVTQMRIGEQIDPGVPWCHATPAVVPGGLHLALKSGNFGSDDFFTKAFGRLQ